MYGRKITAALLAALVICTAACGENNVPKGTETAETKKTAATTARTKLTALTGIIELADDDEPAETTEHSTPEETEETTETAAETEETVTEHETTAPAETTAAETKPVSSEISAESETQTKAAETTVQTTAETTAETTAAPAPDSYDPSFFANDYFIGDSIYTGLSGYGFFPESQVFAKVGLNPQSARTADIKGQTAVTKAQGLQPKRIFIMLGSNGLAYMGNDYMANNMKLLVGDLKAVCPDSAIYVVSIPPVTKAHNDAGQETMEMVNAYNSLLKAMAAEAGAGYLDLCSQLINENGYFSGTYAEADGLHFLGAAYRRMLSFFQTSTA